MKFQLLCTQLLCTCILAVASAVALAEPTTQPLLPADQIPVPAPRTIAEVTPAATPAPAAAAVAPAAAAPAHNWSRVVILPFESLGDAGRRDWVVRAVQQSLSSETARLGQMFPISAPAPANGGPIDTNAALDAARTYNSDVVVFGAIQFAGTDVRFTGQVVDVKTGAAVAGLKASGDFRDLFALEDVLSSQLGRALRPPLPAIAGSRAQDQDMIFTQPAPAITAADLYTPFSDSTLFASDYNRYYYDQTSYEPYFYGGYGFSGLGYYGLGYYPSFYGNYYGPRFGYGGFGGGRGHDHDHR